MKVKIMEKIKKLFQRKPLSLNRVRDKVTIKEGEETITLFVDCDVTGIVNKLRNAKDMIDSLKENTGEDQKKAASMSFAVAIFGEAQAEKLLTFYHGNYGCVVEICGIYFEDKKHGLARKIADVQKRVRR